MKKRVLVSVAAVALVGLMAAFATAAQAFPSRTSACTGCHSGANIPVTATLVSTVGTTATYNFSASGADSVAVFDGSTKLFTFLTPTGTFAVTTGKTYTVYGVGGPGTSDGIGSTTVSPVAPAPTDTTAPVTSSNAVANYVSNATITLTATDAGSGVAATYYKLDGGAQVSGKSISVSALGSHTIEFWSVDVAGNIEVHKTASFTVSAPAPAPEPTPGTYTVQTRISGRYTQGRTATLTDTTSGAKYTALVGKKGAVVFTEIPAGTYRLSVSLKKGEKYVRRITVAAPAPSHHDGDDDDDDDDDSRSAERSHHLRRD